jgi:hypothetical protein
MRLQEAIILIEHLQTDTNKKSEIRAYEGFHEILISLKNRDLAKTEIESIEAKENPKRVPLLFKRYLFFIIKKLLH